MEHEGIHLVLLRGTRAALSWPLGLGSKFIQGQASWLSSSGLFAHQSRDVVIYGCGVLAWQWN